MSKKILAVVGLAVFLPLVGSAGCEGGFLGPLGVPRDVTQYYGHITTVMSSDDKWSTPHDCHTYSAAPTCQSYFTQTCAQQGSWCNLVLQPPPPPPDAVTRETHDQPRDLISTDSSSSDSSSGEGGGSGEGGDEGGGGTGSGEEGSGSVL